MDKIGIFINNTINKKNIEINYHNLLTLYNKFDKVYISDNNNKHSKSLKEKFNDLDHIIQYELNEGFNLFNKINIILKDFNFKNDYHITLITDEYIYLNDLEHYFNFVNKSKYDIISYTDSTEIYYHIQFNIFTIKHNLFNLFYDLLKKYIQLSNENTKFNHLFIDFLKELVMLSNKKGIFCKVAYLDSIFKKNIYLSNSNHYHYLINNNILPIISVKYLDNFNQNYDKQNFVFKEIPLDFDYNIYKKYSDLKDLNNNEIIKHFINFGQFECRKYKSKEIILPENIYNLLNNINLVKYFDFPEYFDFHYYKKLNPDLNDLNKLDLKKHWFNFGVYENREYSQISSII